MRATVVATTRSGSRYVIVIADDGVQWTRLASAARADPMVGWLPRPPRIVQGQRLMLGTLQSTPVTRVSFLPGPDAGPGPAVDSQVQGLPDARSIRSAFESRRH